MYVLLINCHCPDSGCRLKESLATLWRRTFLAFERYYSGSIPAELICFSPNAQCPVGDYLTKCFDSLPDAVRSQLCLLIDDYDAGVRAIERQSDNAEEKRAEWAAMLDRLLHHSEIIVIHGDSYRLLEKRKEGLLTSARAVGTALTD